MRRLELCCRRTRHKPVEKHCERGLASAMRPGDRESSAGRRICQTACNSRDYVECPTGGHIPVDRRASVIALHVCRPAESTVGPDKICEHACHAASPPFRMRLRSALRIERSIWSSDSHAAVAALPTSAKSGALGRRELRCACLAARTSKATFPEGALIASCRDPAGRTRRK